MISWSRWFVHLMAFALVAFLFGCAFSPDDGMGAAEPDLVELTDFDDVDGDADIQKRDDAWPENFGAPSALVGAWSNAREPESPPVDRLLRPPRG